MKREDFLPNGQEPKTQSDLSQIRSLLFDPSLSPTSERISNGQLNPGDPDSCWTLTQFENTVIDSGSTNIHGSREIPVQPCFHCRVNFVCYPHKFTQPEDLSSDLKAALTTIENLSRK